MTREHLCVMALHFLDGIGPIQARRILEFFGTAADFFDRGEADLLAGGKGTSKLRMKLSEPARNRAMSKATDEFREAAARGVQVTCTSQDAYPVRLREAPDHPLVLFSKGQVDLNPKKCIAIVGTRNCSSRGLTWVRRFVEDLADLDVVIVSGMARGIDAGAHRAALDVGLSTWAVCAHGLAHTYPRQHLELAQDIGEQGTLISEFSWGTEPHTLFFPRRNRIVAGLVDAVVVVESHRRGGSLITARLGSEYHREVFAVPGRPDDIASAGCNDLLAGQRAQLIRDAEEFRLHMNWAPPGTPAERTRSYPDHWLPVVEVLRLTGEIHIDDLRARVDVPVLSTVLLEMECDNALKVLPGSSYVLT